MKRRTIKVHEYDETGRIIRVKNVSHHVFPGCKEVWTDDIELAIGLALHENKNRWLDGNDHDLTAEIK